LNKNIGFEIMTKTLDEIWDGDLFGRRLEAEFLSQYLESIWQRPNPREDSKGFVLAVDADYGMGKTFFLTRFAEQMAHNHPVAYIDAWKDDLQDEPLIAIITTLQAAIDEALEKVDDENKDEIIAARKDTWNKLKRVSGIIGKGVLKKAAGMIITASAAEAVSNIIEGEDEEIQKAIEEEIKSIGKDSVDGMVSLSKAVTTGGKLDEKIKDFKEGQEAIKKLKDSLELLAKSFRKNDIHPPIVIIIDELDRCRPTYAIKLLEEVKHLFDVKGLVFVLGVNNNQISKAVKKLYGSDFAAESYLSRFFSRKYTLATPQPEKLIDELISEYSIPLDRFTTHKLVGNVNSNNVQKELIYAFIKYFDVSPRDFFKVFRILQTTIAVTEGNQIFLPVIMRLIIKEIKGEYDFQKLSTKFDENVKFMVYSTAISGSPSEVSAKQYFSQIDDIVNRTINQLQNLERSGDGLTYRIYHVLRNHMRFSNDLHNVGCYSKLINWVQKIE